MCEPPLVYLVPIPDSFVRISSTSLDRIEETTNSVDSTHGLGITTRLELRMILLITFWAMFGLLSFGPLVFNFISMKRLAQKPWKIKIEESFKPKVSVLVPTYNESRIIRLKLENLTKLTYPRNLMQIIVVDSNSNDQTVNIVNDFIKHHDEINIQVLTESERRGKSAALNFALDQCEGDVIVISDADCFWPADILDKALPYLADPQIGAISGPKVLLNPGQSWVTETEDTYLESINLVRLGESKIGSTLLFEGGFSAYKKDVLEAFDPYNTGSDDCGTIIKLVENNSRAIFVPEARFFTAFPSSLRGRMNIKTRRANQLIRVFRKYAALLFRNHLRNSRRVVLQNIIVYLISPFTFVAFVVTTILLVLAFPVVLAVLVALLIPRMRFYLFESIQGFLVLLFSILSIISGKKMIVWATPEDRTLLSEDILDQRMLI